MKHNGSGQWKLSHFTFYCPCLSPNEPECPKSSTSINNSKHQNYRSLDENKKTSKTEHEGILLSFDIEKKKREIQFDSSTH